MVRERCWMLPHDDLPDQSAREGYVECAPTLCDSQKYLRWLVVGVRNWRIVGAQRGAQTK
jgi:hypothetical protein